MSIDFGGVDPYYLPNFPQGTGDPADRTCPDDCADAYECGCGCGALVCMAHDEDDYEMCESRGPILLDHHVDVCRDPECLGVVDPDPDWGDEA